MICLFKHFLYDSHLFKFNMLTVTCIPIIELAHLSNLSVLLLLSVTLLNKLPSDLNLHILLIEVFDVRFNKLESIGHLCDLSHLDIVCLIVSIEDVLFDGRVEEERLLHDNSNLLSKLSHVVVTDVDSIDQELALSQVIESKEKVRGG
jgi:hypothetical protein